jgi:hypothetical protein
LISISVIRPRATIANIGQSIVDPSPTRGKMSRHDLRSPVLQATFPERRYFDDDLKAIKNAGFNAVQLWVLWGWVEPELGVFRFDDYDDYDELFDIAQRHGLGVVLSTVAEIQPY